MKVKIKVLLWFDVEDYVTLQSDDALLLLLDMLNARGVRAVLKFVGEKARVLKERGRTDILDKIADHEIGYHTNMHSEHPTVSEFLEPFGFRDGAYEFEKREGSGLEDVEAITSKHSVIYGQPGRAWAPQVFPVIRKWSMPAYVTTIKRVTVNKKPFWYGGILNMANLDGQLRMEFIEDGVEEAKKKFDNFCDGIPASETAFVSIYYHPCEFATTEFWDACNFGRGLNTPREKWKGAPLRTKDEMKNYVDMLGQFIDYMMSKEYVEFVTSADVLALEKTDNGHISISDIKTIAKNISNEVYYYVDKTINLSASEIFSLFCRYINGDALEPELLYGPENDIVTDITGKVKVSDIKRALNMDYPRIFDYKQLPDYFMIGGKRINPIDMTCTLASIIRRGSTEDDEADVVKGYLKSRIYVDEESDYSTWIIFPENFKVPNIRKMAGLQAWTLKPALF